MLQLSRGDVLGDDFRIVGPLSAGGMGAVHIAEQLSTGQRRAVKVMHPQLVAEPGLRRRFEQEARVSGMIRSDHVVQVIAAGVEPSGLPWIAMELLEGRNLADCMDARGRLTLAELHGVLQQLCHALAAAHDAGVVHRDIKPANVFVAESQHADRASAIKVLDFGVAKVAAEARTAATASVGSPAWMAPEQTDPRAVISPSSDVWAIGLLAYWLISGKPFWSAANDPHSSMHALMREILFEPIPQPHERAREQGVSEWLPPGFGSWFSRCVTRDPQQRYADARLALRAFEAQLECPADVDSDAVSALLDERPNSRPPSQPLGQPPSQPLRPTVPMQPWGADTDPTVSTPPARWRPVRAVAFGLAALATATVVVWVAGSLKDDGANPDPATTIPQRALTPEATPAGAAPTFGAAAPTAHRPAPQPASRPRRPWQAPAAPTASAAASVALGTAEPSAAAASASARSGLPPFDEDAARQALDGSRTRAMQRCHSHEGARPLTLSVQFAASGAVAQVDVHGGHASAAAFCVQSQFWGAKIPAFEGPSQVRRVDVTLVAAPEKASK